MAFTPEAIWQSGRKPTSCSISACMSQRRNVDSLKRDDAVIMYDDAVIMYNEPGNAVALHPGTGSPRVAFMFRSRARIDHRDPDAVRG
jgi:hypothetical protein